MVRFIFAILFVVIFLILSIVLMGLVNIIGLFSRKSKDKCSRAIIRWAFSVVKFFAGAKVTVKGLDRISKDATYLYVGNHRSIFDVVLSYIYLPAPTGYIAKKEINKVPLFRVWMRNIRCLFLDRDNIKEGLKTTLAAIEQVKSGVSVFVFPEGTRSKVAGSLLPFHAGSFKIAEKGKVPIVPVSFYYSDTVFEDHVPKLKKQRVIIEFGEPVDISEWSTDEKKEIAEYFRNKLETMYKANESEFINNR